MTINIDLYKQSSPLFISVEGGEGCGKTTQLKLIEKAFIDAGIETIFTREPGGTKDGEKIRAMLLKGNEDKWNTAEELLMFSAARSKHVRTVIKPALKNHKWVISDRFIDSTTVYQGYAQNFDMKTVNYLHELAINETMPDLTILLDIPVEIGLARKNSQAEDGLDELRMENLGYSFHKIVRSGFLELAQQNTNRIKVIDATGTIEEVQQKIIKEINNKLQENIEKIAI